GAIDHAQAGPGKEDRVALSSGCRVSDSVLPGRTGQRIRCEEWAGDIRPTLARRTGQFDRGHARDHVHYPEHACAPGFDPPGTPATHSYFARGRPGCREEPLG